MNKYSKELYNFLSSIWKSFAVGLCSQTDKEKSVWAATPVRAFGRGFTLVELLVVVLVIGILAAIALPVYNRSVQKSRMSDALNVLDIAASKQQANYVAGEGYASSFNDLDLPVQGLTGNIESSMQGVKAGNFTYTLQNTCVVASRPEDDVTIYRNFNTDETGCSGEGCKLLDGIVSNVPIGCSEYTSEEEEASAITPPSVISCSFDKCLSDAGTCISTNSTCIQGRIITQSCGNGGVQMKKCLEGCPNYWSEWSDCINQTCRESERPASVDRAGCGYCANGTTYRGVRTRSVTCNTSTGQWTTGSWSSCVDENTCAEADCSETNSCECSQASKPSVTVGCGTKCSNGQYMGIQTRTVTCNQSTGEWYVSSTGECASNYSCCPGETSTVGCLWGVTKTCQANGQWGECNYKLCTGKEPESQRECADADNIRTCGMQVRSVDCDLSKGEYVTGEWTGTCTAPKYNKVPETVQFCGTCGSQTRTCQKTCDGLGQCENWLACTEVPVPPTSQPNSQYCSYHGTKNSPEVCDGKPTPSYSVDFENTGTCDCYTYFYGPTCGTECSLPGMYWNTGNCETCTNKTVGKYWTGNGITSAICPDATCTNKPIGYYWTGHGGTGSTCSVLKCTNAVIGQYYTSFSKTAKTTGWIEGTSPTGCSVAACTNKPYGYYWTSGGGVTATSCANSACTNKPVGKYWSGHGGTSATCPTADCTNADIGEYYTSFSQSAKDSSSAKGTSPVGCSVGTCTNTVPGKYWTTSGGTSSTGCANADCTNTVATGKYYSGHGGTSATGCAVSDCTNKPTGYYWTGKGNPGDADSCPTAKCTNTTAGQYWTGFGNTSSTCPSASCTNKTVGKYWNGHGGTVSTGCSEANCTNTVAAGKYYSGHGGNSATGCAISSCTNKPTGYYWTGKGNPGDADSCPTAKCTNTTAGKYWTSHGGTSATGCTNADCTNTVASGKYYSGHGGTSATGCAVSSCTNKPTGYYWTGKGNPGDADSCPTAKCTNTTVGQYWTGFGNTSSTCPSASCTNRTIGKYWTGHGGTSAKGCAEKACTNTTAGKYWTSHGGTSARGCTNADCTNTVATGKYYSGHGGTSANGCAVSSCTNKPTGYYWTGKGNPGDADSCPTAKCTNTTAGQYWTGFGNTSSSCPSASCTNKTVGKYWTGHGGTSATGCAEAACTRKPSKAYFSGHGGASNSCAYTCIKGYTRSGDSCVSDTSVAATCPSGYSGSATKRTVITSSLSGDTTKITYDYSKCYRNDSTAETSSVSCPSGYPSGSATKSLYYRYYCTDTAQTKAGTCSAERKDVAWKTNYNYSNCYKDTGGTACSTYSSTFNKGTTTKREWSNTKGNGVRLTQWPSVATQCYYDTTKNCSEYSSTYDLGTANRRYYAGGTNSWTNATSSCYYLSYPTTSGQACPSGYSGSSIRKDTVKVFASGSKSTTGSTYNLTDCYKNVLGTAAACSQTARYKSGTASGNLAGTKYTCTNTAASSTSSCSTTTSTIASSANYRNCYYDTSSTTSGYGCPSGYSGSSKKTVKTRHYANTSGTADRTTSTVSTTYNLTGCYKNVAGTAAACSQTASYKSGTASGNLTGTKYTCTNTAATSTSSCSASTSSIASTANYQNCYYDTSSTARNQACPSGYTSGGSVATKTTTTRHYANTAGTADRTTSTVSTKYNYNSCYAYTTGSSCPSGYSGSSKKYTYYSGSVYYDLRGCYKNVTGAAASCSNTSSYKSGTASGNLAGTKYTCTNSWTSNYRSCSTSTSTIASTANYQNCYYDTSSTASNQACPSGYTSGGSVATKTTKTRHYANTAGTADRTTSTVSTEYNYNSCYAYTTGSSCPSGYSGSSKKYTYYSGSVYYDLRGCYKNVTGAAASCSNTRSYKSGTASGNLAGTKYTCTNSWTSSYSSCSTSTSTIASTANYQKCYYDSSSTSGSQACPSGYTSGGSVATKTTTTRHYANTAGTADRTTSTVSTKYNYSSCYKTSTGSQACPSGYTSGGSVGVKSSRLYCTNKATSTYGSCGTTEEKYITYNYSSCYKTASASGQACPSGYTSGGSVGVKKYRLYCSNTATSTYGSCGNTTTKNVTYDYSDCYKTTTDGSQACPSGYTSGGSVGKKTYKVYCGNTATSTYGSCGTTRTSNVTYNYSNCYKTASASSQACPSGYTAGGNLAVKNYRLYCGNTATSTYGSCGTTTEKNVTYNYSSCFDKGTCNTKVGSGYCGTATKKYGASSYSGCSTCLCSIGTVVYDTNTQGTACTAPKYKAKRFCWDGSWTRWSSCSSSPSAPICPKLAISAVL